MDSRALWQSEGTWRAVGGSQAKTGRTLWRGVLVSRAAGTKDHQPGGSPQESPSQVLEAETQVSPACCLPRSGELPSLGPARGPSVTSPPLHDSPCTCLPS